MKKVKFTPMIVFEMVGLLNKAGFTAKKVALMFDDEADKEKFGQELFETVLTLPELQDDFYNLLVKVTGLELEATYELDFDEIEEAFKNLLSTSKRMDFLKRAFKKGQLTSVSEDTE